MNRLEALLKCEELGIDDNSSLEEVQSMGNTVFETWVRSRTYLAEDELPVGVAQRSAAKAAQLRKAANLQKQYAN